MKIIATLLCLTCATSVLAADSTIGNLGPITTVPDTYRMPWENPGVADNYITFNNLTNQILAGMASKAYADSKTNAAGIIGIVVSGVNPATNTAAGIVSALDYTPLGSTSNAVSATTASFVTGTLSNNITGNAATATSATNVVGGTVSATTGMFTGNITQTSAAQTNTFLSLDGNRTSSGNVIEYKTNGVSRFSVNSAGNSTFAGTINSSTIASSDEVLAIGFRKSGSASFYVGNSSTPTVNLIASQIVVNTTLSVTNGFNYLPTNAPPSNVTLGVTTPDAWVCFTNAGVRMFMPAWSNH